MLQKKSLKLDVNGHTSHKKYNDAIDAKITEIINDSNGNNMLAFDRIKKLIQKSKDKLEKEVLLGNKDVNDIVNF